MTSRIEKFKRAVELGWWEVKNSADQSIEIIAQECVRRKPLDEAVAEILIRMEALILEDYANQHDKTALAKLDKALAQVLGEE